MNQKLLNLLEGSPVAPKSHPVLVSLLSMAAQGARAKGSDAAMRARLARDWHKVAAAFRRCVSAGITDEKLRAAMPFPGLSFTDEKGWRITAPLPLKYRALVAGALDATANASDGILQPFEITDLETLREARRRNHLPGIETPVTTKGDLEETLPGRPLCLIVSRELFGLRMSSLLQADEFGRLSALCHRGSPLECRKFHAKDLKKRGRAKP